MGRVGKDSSDRKLFLNKNKSVKIFKEKQNRRNAYTERRDKLRSQYDEIDTSKVEKFDQLPLTQETRRGLKKCGYKVPTEIQLETIGLALKGHDILGAAKTGSGKTLAFVIPILERLFCEGWCKSDGLGVLVITPTRELALQIFEVCRDVGTFHGLTIGLIIGGKGLKEERKILNLYNVVICTPGRLLQHMDENPLFDAMNLQMLVLDEADRILDLGFQRDMNSIIENLPQERQTLLFSATQTKSVKDLARLSLKDPMYVSVHEHAKHATPESLQQSYLVCELHKKMDFLWSFIKSHRKQKILIFISSCKQVKYTYEAFCRMKPGVSLTALYGDLHQLRRMERYKDFCNKNFVVMFATDLAARGLDFPNVNWVVQLDCPEDTNTYIHRAGRTARYQKGGESLLILLPSEKDSMISQLEKRKIPINEIRVHPSKMSSIQRKMEALCARDVCLKESAQRAFKSYYKSYFLMKDKTIFNINYLDEDEIREEYAKSLGLALAPRIRFIEKRLKNKDSSANTRQETNNQKISLANAGSKVDDDGKGQFNFADDDDSEDEFLKPKSSGIHSSGAKEEMAKDEEEELEEYVAVSAKRKPLTKAAVVKRILKKNIKPNTKVVFNEEGEVVEETPRMVKAETPAGKLLKEMAEEGYSVEKAKLIMEEEDKVDKEIFLKKIKEKHREKRLKLKKERCENERGAAVLAGPSLGEDSNDEDEAESSDAGDVDPNDFMLSSRDDSNESDERDDSIESDERDDSIESDERDDSIESDERGGSDDDSGDLTDGDDKSLEETRKRKTADSTQTANSKKSKHSVTDKLSVDDQEALALHFLAS